MSIKRIAVYPGTFDPITNGHIDLIQRGLFIFDELIIAIADNPQKEPLFNIQERKKMVETVTKGFIGVQVDTFDELLIDYIKKQGAGIILRGLRAVSDFEFELQIALTNRELNGQIETIFMMPSKENIYLSSRIVREVASFGGAVSNFVPPYVEERLREKFKG